MQKILFVSSKHLSKNLLDGAQQRMYQIMKSLSKKNIVDFVCVDNSDASKINEIKFCNQKKIFKINFLSRIINTLICIIKLEPMQNGFFYSKKMSNFISENKDDYDVIIFHLTRCAEYLPKDFGGTKILEASDLASLRYAQIVKYFSILNPIKYLFWIEKILLSSYERKIFNFFDKIVFVSKNELSKTKKIVEQNKIRDVKISFQVQKRAFAHNLNNYKILFVGNINYLPNKIACYNFARRSLPKINIRYPKIKFHIIGKINIIDKFLLQSSNVVVHGPIKKLDGIFKRAICGLCNIDVATGLQSKIFTYMSYGLPSVVSQKAYPQSIIKKNKEILVYKNDSELISHIFKLIENKTFSNKISINSYNCIKKKFNLKKIYRGYVELIK